MNNSRWASLLGGILLLSLSSGFSQDTLRYKYISEFTDEFSSSRNVLQYFVEDSIFVIDGLFRGYLQNYFKVKDGQWFMKDDSDWKIFFNGKEEKCGSWLIGGYAEYIITWKKTNIIDNADTIYKFSFIPVPLQMGNNTEMEFVEADVIDPYYFTYSSGIIAFSSAWIGLLIREDKIYLKEILTKDISLSK